MEELLNIRSQSVCLTETSEQQTDVFGFLTFFRSVAVCWQEEIKFTLWLQNSSLEFAILAYHFDKASKGF